MCNSFYMSKVQKSFTYHIHNAGHQLFLYNGVNRNETLYFGRWGADQAEAGSRRVGFCEFDVAAPFIHQHGILTQLSCPPFSVGSCDEPPFLHIDLPNKKGQNKIINHRLKTR